MPTAAKLWNKCVKLQKFLIQVNKYYVREFLVWFIGAVWFLQIILTVWRQSTLIKQTPRFIYYHSKEVHHQSEKYFDLSGLLKKKKL